MSTAKHTPTPWYNADDLAHWITEPRNQSLRICVECQGSIQDN